MVSQQRLRKCQSTYLNASHLSCAFVVVFQYQVTVKLYGVFPSSRGLIRIFTYTTISPGGLLRQCPDHYAIRAGQNLPDKEFRYLWTIIVIAAVHWGFNSLLRCYRLSSILQIILTFQHWAGVSSYTSAYAFAETCVFDKQSLGPIHCGSFSRPSLIPKLRDHCAEFLNHSSLAHLRILSLTTCVGS